MNIFVLVKTVHFVCSQTGTDISKNYVGPDDVIPIVNPLDEFAVEFALMIKDQMPDTRITAVTLGNQSADNGLKKCLAMGVDEAVHLFCSDVERFDSWTVAGALSFFMRQQSFDLVLAGRQAIDTHAGLAGPYLAEMLQIPRVSGVVALEVKRNDRKVLLQRAVERGNREVLECRLPALLTIEKNIMNPRYPTLAGRLRAEKQPIEKVRIEDLAEPDASPTSEHNIVVIESISNPKPKRKARPPVQKKMSAADRMRLLMKGGKKERQQDSKLIDADSDEAIHQVERILREHEILVD
jgi:electron transfer flavoprotein beta subunit